MKKLRAAYYSGKTDLFTVSHENIALMSDLNFRDSVLKSVKLQADANDGRKNIFLFRYSVHLKLIFPNFWCILKIFVSVFRFGVNDKLNWIKYLDNATHDGAAHAEELCYIFQYLQIILVFNWMRFSILFYISVAIYWTKEAYMPKF